MTNDSQSMPEKRLSEADLARLDEMRQRFLEDGGKPARGARTTHARDAQRGAARGDSRPTAADSGREHSEHGTGDRSGYDVREAIEATSAGYWYDERSLELYDAVFAERIGWKIDALLGELAWRGWTPPAGRVLDWGCGTGVFARRFGAHFGWQQRSLALFDRCAPASAFVARRVRVQAPELALEVLDANEVRAESSLAEATDSTPPAVLLVSHVLGELSGDDERELLALAERATAVLWVEPGDRRTSRRLALARERLRATSRVVAPCPHQASCGMLAPEQERNWCHLMAAAPPHVHTSRFWRAVSHGLGIDLRALPYSAIALDRRDEAAGAVPTGDVTRILGRPRMEKGAARLDACRASGVAGLRFLQRLDKPLFRRLAEPAGERFFWSVEESNGRILGVREWRGGGAG